MRHRALAMTVAGITLGAAACSLGDRPQPLVFCHNANCTGDTAPSRADTLDGLRAALALEGDGRPILDGIELDVAWDETHARCAYAHDGERAMTHADLVTAVGEIAAWRAANQRELSFLLDLKPGPRPDAVARCARDAAVMLEYVLVSSSEPAALRELADAAFPLLAGTGAPRPLGDSRALAAFDGVPLAGVTLHPRWTTDQQVIAYRDAGLDLVVWSHVLSVESLDAIDRIQPFAVITGDVELMRAWIAR